MRKQRRIFHFQKLVKVSSTTGNEQEPFKPVKLETNSDSDSDNVNDKEEEEFQVIILQVKKFNSW